MEQLPLLYMTCSIPSVAMPLVDIYVMLCVAPCVLWLYMDGSDLDTSVGHYPYGIIWLTPYWAPLDHGVAIDVSVGYM